MKEWLKGWEHNYPSSSSLPHWIILSHQHQHHYQHHIVMTRCQLLTEGLLLLSSYQCYSHSNSQNLSLFLLYCLFLHLWAQQFHPPCCPSTARCPALCCVVMTLADSIHLVLVQRTCSRLSHDTLRTRYRCHCYCCYWGR